MADAPSPLRLCLSALEELAAAEWQPDFIAGKYDSDEPEENALRAQVLSAIEAARSALGRRADAAIGEVKGRTSHGPATIVAWPDGQVPPMGAKVAVLPLGVPEVETQQPVVGSSGSDWELVGYFMEDDGRWLKMDNIYRNDPDAVPLYRKRNAGVQATDGGQRYYCNNTGTVGAACAHCGKDWAEHIGRGSPCPDGVPPTDGGQQ